MKTNVYITAPCMFMAWNQLRRIVSTQFYRILKRDVHPHTFFDNEYWSVYFDTLTDDEIKKLLCFVPVADYKKQWLKKQLENKRNEFMPETVIAVIRDDVPFNFNRYIANADGIMFFGHGDYIKMRRNNKE